MIFCARATRGLRMGCRSSGRSMRAVKDSPVAPYESKCDVAVRWNEDPRWTRAVGDHLAHLQGGGHSYSKLEK
jgi:hypothetical protein